GPPPMQGNRFELGGSRRGVDLALLRANPSKVIATELAFARTAQEKGQWTAFAEYATADAVMFVPEAVNAQAWLKGRANPPEAVRWQPHEVWSSCDGSLAATRGPWQRPDGSVGYFTTVWQRQRDGEYRWVMDQGDVLPEPLEAPEMIGAVTAACDSQPTPPAEMLAGPENAIRSGAARDGTLRWHVVVRPDGSRSVVARYWDGEEWQTAFDDRVAAGGCRDRAVPLGLRHPVRGDRPARLCADLRRPDRQRERGAAASHGAQGVPHRRGDPAGLRAVRRAAAWRAAHRTRRVPHRRRDHAVPDRARHGVREA